MVGRRAPTERDHVPHAEPLVLERDVGLHVDRKRVRREWHVRPAEEEERPAGDGEVAGATLNRAHHGPLPRIEPFADASAHPERAERGQALTSIRSDGLAGLPKCLEVKA